MLPPPPATPRTLIVKIEPTSRAFLVGGTFSRKHHITRILCCIPNRECAVRTHRDRRAPRSPPAPANRCQRAASGAIRKRAPLPIRRELSKAVAGHYRASGDRP